MAQFKITSQQQDFVDSIIEKYQHRTDANKIGPFAAYTNGLSPEDIVLLQDAFSECLEFDVYPNEQIHQAMVLVAINPWPIHTDYQKGDERPAKAVLIPYQTQDTHTIVFNELNLGDPILDMPDVDNSISEEFYHKHLTHCSPEARKKVSLKEKFAWQRGHAVTWNRTELHTSDNYLNNGVGKKVALVFFTKYV